MLRKIILTVIVLHLIVGFGVIIWKIAGPVKDDVEGGNSTDIK
jgi:hypothetical protein